MEFVTYDNYLNHPRGEAYSYFQDEKNLKTMKVFLTVLLFIHLIATLIRMFENDDFNLAIPVVISIVNLLFIIFLRFFYTKIFKQENIRKYTYAFLVLQLILMLAGGYFRTGDVSDTSQEQTRPNSSLVHIDSTDKNDDVNIDLATNENPFNGVVFFFLIALLIFRFSKNELIQLFIIGAGVPATLDLLIHGSLSAEYIPLVFMAVFFFSIAYFSESKRQKQFYEQYDFHFRKNYDNRRMKKELDSAREIQLSMLPDREAMIGGLEISGISIPASEVGGDYFDYFKISEKKTGVFICDVSGHGVASALLLSGLRSCMHLILEDTTDPEIVMEKLNRMVRRTQNRKMFVTAIFAIIDTEKNTCELYNAGHLPPFKISGSTGEIFKIKQHGITLGAIEKLSASNNNSRVMFEFNKEDKLVLYTDGVNEAMNAGRDEYGFENMELIINNNTSKKPGEILDLLVGDIKRFVQDTPPRDDITILTIGRT